MMYFVKWGAFWGCIFLHYKSILIWQMILSSNIEFICNVEYFWVAECMHCICIIPEVHICLSPKILPPPQSKSREGNVFSPMCLSVCTGPQPFLPSLYKALWPMYRTPALLLTDMFKPVKLGPRYTGRQGGIILPPATCFNLFTMGHGLSTNGQLAFDWNSFLFNRLVNFTLSISAWTVKVVCFWTGTWWY